jgi:hypothetical protein
MEKRFFMQNLILSAVVIIKVVLNSKGGKSRPLFQDRIFETAADMHRYDTNRYS